MESKMRERIASFTKKDFRVDTFPAGGPGGQHQNKTQSAVRITHVATGLSATARESRSQHINKKTAFHRLAELIKRHFQQAFRKERITATDVVRTYHHVENRITDKLTGEQVTWDEFFDDPEYMINARARAIADQN